MSFGIPKYDFSLYKARRTQLLEAVKQKQQAKQGVIVLFAGFEGETRAFTQESSFYYYTGITEPGVVMMLDLTGKSTLFVPNCGDTRSKWVFSQIELTQNNATVLGFDQVTPLGVLCTGYQFHPFFPQAEYENLLKKLQEVISVNGSICTLNPSTPHGYVEQRLIVQRLESFMPGIGSSIIDIAPLVAAQRRVKDMREIELLYKAAEITMIAQEAAAHTIEHELVECEVQAALEHVMTASGAQIAFPSIVASGAHSTVLHYTVNKGIMKDGDLVVVDIGAQYGQYCADLTRTYPVSGEFTKRQLEIYTIVLETQEYIASIAKPGYWLNNKNVPEKSLNHLARQFLAKKGYDQYFLHGIGHFLGLDVHDVGDYTQPLQEGDVFTIEPGIYIAQEKLGVRIEDDYWVVKDGVVCLSESLPKKPEEIEAFMQDQEYMEELEYDEDHDQELSEA